VGRLECTRMHTGSESFHIAGIGALTNLRELRVSGNKLSSLSAEVGSLRKLHRLIADNNLLTSIPGGSTHLSTPDPQHYATHSGAARVCSPPT